MFETENYANTQIATATTWYEGQLVQQPTPAAAYATQTKPILSIQYTTMVVSSNVGNFSNTPANDTILRAMNSNDPLSTILQDCIPCLGRILNIGDMNLMDDFLNLLEDEISKRWAYINSLWSSLGTPFNICDLLNYFNSLCIPDLFALLAALSYYWIQLMSITKFSIWNILWSLVAPLLQSILAGLDALLQKFITLIMAPLDCIINSINHEYAKIYNLTHMSVSKEKGFSLNNPYDNSFSKWANDNIKNPVLNGSSVTYGYGLLQLKDTAIGARNFVNAQLQRLRNSIKESLGVGSSSLNDAQGLFTILRWLSLVIGLVRAIIKFKQDGFSCNPDGFSEPQYTTIIQYLTETTGLIFETYLPDDVITPIEPWIPDTDDPNAPIDDPTISTGQIIQDAAFQSMGTEAIAALTSQAGTVRLPDCIQVQNQLERAKVTDWQTALDAINL